MNSSASAGRRWMVAVVLIMAMGLGAVVWRVAVGQTGSPASNDAAVAQAKGLSMAFRAAAKKVIPTVVKITTATKPKVVDLQRGDSLRENPFKGTPFEDFFGEEEPGPGSHFYRRTPGRYGLGSGVIIDRSGIILTNNHVVEGADTIMVELDDGREFKAVDVKTDPQSDLALVRIDAKGPLPAAVFGDSDALEIGDWVIAVGNPFNWQGTVSAGIVSGKGRSLQVGKRTDFIQTDAAINPGNSGGPLVNLDGQVVGINTAIESSTGLYQGLGFAIPSNLAKWVTKQLETSGSVQRAYLGVAISEINGPLARHFGLQGKRGVLVSEVYPGSPAAKAGFKVGDVIVGFGGQEVHDPRRLQEMVERSPAGTKQTVDIIRDGRATALQVEVKPLPEDFGVASTPSLDRPAPGRSPGFHSDALGLEVGELTDALAQRLGYQGHSGVLVTGVDEGGVAAAAGIRAGMLILQVGKRPVQSVAEFKAGVKDQSLKEGVVLLIRAGGGNHFVLLQSS
jgi:serine protease Do